MIEVLSVDPGVKSGLVRGLVTAPGLIEPLEWWELDQQETGNLMVAWCQKQGRRGPAGRKSVLLVERFIPRGGQGKALTFIPASVEIAGVGRWASTRFGVRFVMQSPADMHMVRALAVAAFPKIGRGGEGHAKDALAHLYLFA